MEKAFCWFSVLAKIKLDKENLLYRLTLCSQEATNLKAVKSSEFNAHGCSERQIAEWHAHITINEHECESALDPMQKEHCHLLLHNSVLFRALTLKDRSGGFACWRFFNARLITSAKRFLANAFCARKEILIVLIERRAWINQKASVHYF